MRKRILGQVSVEMLMILAVLLVLVAGLYIFTQTQTASIGIATEKVQAENALADLSAAAKEVYAQGLGAKKQVYVTVPSGIDPMNTYVENQSIKMRANGNDYMKTESFDLHGTLPTSPGGHWVWVLSEGNKVRIGYAMIELSRQTLLVTMEANQTRQDTFSIRNIWTKPINITITYNWVHDEDAAFSLDRTTAELEPGESEIFRTTVVTDEDAIGIYVSDLTIIADDGDGVEHVKLPVILQVIPNPNARPPLIVRPPIFNASIDRLNSSTHTFQVCTNEFTELEDVYFYPSTGAPGDWVTGNEPLGYIGKDTCLPKKLTVSVPEDAPLTNFTGFIRVEGKDNEKARDSIALLIEVAGGGDTQCPAVYNITTIPKKVHVNETAIVLATADDREFGDSWIKSCEIVADDGPVEYMFPVDGGFDSAVENVSFVYPKTYFSFGMHNISIACVDWLDNVCDPTTYSFVIGKHILFVVSAGNESIWSDWIKVHSSEAGYSYEYDVANFDDIMSGRTQLGFYDVVIFIDWKNDDDFLEIVLDYLNNGGWTGLFGDSAHLAVRDLNVDWHPDNPHPETFVNILDDSHYITNNLKPGFTTGRYNITDTFAKVYSIFGDPNATELGATGWFYPSTDRILLSEADGTVFWGPMDPFKLNEDGVRITIRVIDYMINKSLSG